MPFRTPHAAAVAKSFASAVASSVASPPPSFAAPTLTAQASPHSERRIWVPLPAPILLHVRFVCVVLWFRFPYCITRRRLPFYQSLQIAFCTGSRKWLPLQNGPLPWWLLVVQGRWRLQQACGGEFPWLIISRKICCSWSSEWQLFVSLKISTLLRHPAQLMN